MEYHGDGMYEGMTCECVYENAPDDPESQRQIDLGNFEIISAHREDRSDHSRYW